MVRGNWSDADTTLFETKENMPTDESIQQKVTNPTDTPQEQGEENTESHESESERDTDDDRQRTPNERGRVCPKILRTGKGGRPKKQYNHKENIEEVRYPDPKTIKQAMESEDRDL